MGLRTTTAVQATNSGCGADELREFFKVHSTVSCSNWDLSIRVMCQWCGLYWSQDRANAFRFRSWWKHDQV